MVFGHIHRAGPLPGDDLAEWEAPTGARLWNTGNWYHEPAFVSEAREHSPYWPGTVTEIDGEGPPRIHNVLRDVAVPAPSI